MESKTVLAYLYQQYQDDLDLRAFVSAYNTMAQEYVDWFNRVNLPIYSGLSGDLLSLIGAGVYGLPRPTLGIISGAIYNTFAYNSQNYGSGFIGGVTVPDDVYKRILTWKLYRGDGFVMSLPWLKRRVKRFIVGVDGTTPDIESTGEISIKITSAQAVEIVIDYPEVQSYVDMFVQYLDTGILDLPFQYTVNARSA